MRGSTWLRVAVGTTLVCRCPSALAADEPSAEPTDPTEPTQPAEPAEATEREGNHVTYFELLGAGVFWTANYERTVRDVVSMRLGFGIVPVAVFVPVTVSYHGIGTLAHSLEVAVGTTIIHWNAGSGGTTDAGGLFALGYRYQRPQGGFFLRAGLNVHLQDRAFRDVTDGLVLPWPYLGVGGTFPP